MDTEVYTFIAHVSRHLEEIFMIGASLNPVSEEGKNEQPVDLNLVRLLGLPDWNIIEKLQKRL